MKAIGNNIIISPRKEGLTKTDSGLFLKEKDKENIRYKEAVVVSVSEDIKSIKEIVKQFDNELSSAFDNLKSEMNG